MATDALKILQINLNHSKAATSHLAITAHQLDVQVILIQDPYLLNGRIHGIPNAWLKHHSGNKKAWIVVTTNKFITNCQKSFNSAAFITFTLANNEQLIIGSQYVPPKEDLNAYLQEWTGHYELTARSSSCLLVGGDFNARSFSWGYPYEDNRGQILISLLLAHDLSVANEQGCPPTYERDGRQGWPDLTIIRTRNQHQITDWKVLRQASQSDHNYIMFNLNTHLKHKLIRRFKTKHGKIGAFKKKIRATIPPTDIEDIQTQEQLDSYTHQLQQKVYDIAKKCFKMKTYGKAPKFNWWTPSLRTKRNLVNALYKKLKSTNTYTQEETSNLKEQYNKHKAQYRKQIIKQRSAAWKKFCTQYQQTFGTTFKIGNDRVFNPTDVTVDWGQGFLDHSTINTRLLKEHFPEFNDTDRQEIYRKIESLHQTDEPPLQPHEIDYVLRHLHPNKAPGTDGLDLRIWQYVHKANKNILKQFLSKCLQLTHFPRALKLGEVVFFHKKGKDPNQPASYRPVCLLPALGKILEKIIHRRIYYHLDKTQALYEHQYGFRQGRSCVQALQVLTNRLATAKKEGLQSIALSLDIKGAFDNVIWSRVLMRLLQLNTPTQLIRIMASYLCNRSATTQGDTSSYIHEIFRGCPQGSVLGPLCWLLIAEEFLSIVINTPNLLVLVYADDFLIVITGNNWITMAHLQHCITKLLEEWILNNQLTISKEKTTATLIWKKGNQRPRVTPSLRLFGEKIKITPEFKFLGLTITYTLNWNKHIQSIRCKTQAINKNISIVAAKGWGTSSEKLRTWYHAVTEKIVTYAAGVWALDLPKSSQEKILAMQRPFLVNITRAFKTAPTSALCLLASIQPLHITLQQEAKIQRSLQLQLPITIHDIQYEPSKIECKVNPLLIHPAHLYCKNIEWKQTGIHSNAPSTMIYTDGSKTDHGTASAFVAYRDNQRCHEWSARVPDYASVYQAELYAIKQAILWHINQDPTENLHIYTDSKSSLQAFSKDNQRNPYIQGIQQLIMRNQHYSLHWVRGHAGTEGNEAADMLARGATQCRAVDPTDIRMSIRHIKNLLAEEAREHWQDYWNCHTTGKYTRKLLPTINLPEIVRTSGQTAFLTGHGPFPEYKHRFNSAISSTCVCGEEGNALHYIQTCPLTAAWHIAPLTAQNRQLWTKHILTNKTVIAKLNMAYSWLNAHVEELCATTAQD